MLVGGWRCYNQETYLMKSFKYIAISRPGKSQSQRIIFNSSLALIGLLGFTLLNSMPASLTHRSYAAASYAENTNTVQITSPLNNSYVANNISVSADLAHTSNNNYDMFWYVDNGQWNWMSNSFSQNTKTAEINLTNWTWHNPAKSYTIDVVAVINSTGQRIYGSVTINIGAAPSLTTAGALSSTSTSTYIQSTGSTSTAPLSTIKAQPASTLAASQALYVNPDNEAALTAANTSDPTLKAIMTRLSRVPTATWFGNWDSNIQSDVNSLVTNGADLNQTPVLVAYNLPERDCSSYSGGGAPSASAYETWIKDFADGIGNRRTIVILEPDALAQISCLSPADQATRYQLLNYAVDVLTASPNSKVYIDAGNPDWISAATMAQRLNKAGVAKTSGFSLNVSNFISTASNISYGNQLSALVGNKHYVIDTGRNGNGSDGQWCNPLGRALGATPTGNTGNAKVDYYLWIKIPGESDGTCNGGPSAGTWWPSYAETLALNAGW